MAPLFNSGGWNLACNPTRLDPAVLFKSYIFCSSQKNGVSSFQCDWGTTRSGFPECPLWFQKWSAVKTAASTWELLDLEISAYLLEGSSSRLKICTSFFHPGNRNWLFDFIKPASKKNLHLWVPYKNSSDLVLFLAKRNDSKYVYILRLFWMYLYT